MSGPPKIFRRMPLSESPLGGLLYHVFALVKNIFLFTTLLLVGALWQWLRFGDIGGPDELFRFAIIALLIGKAADLDAFIFRTEQEKWRKERREREGS